jgi:regulator of sigma E protease
LISISLMAGFPSVVSDGSVGEIQNQLVVVTNVLEDSPAAQAGIQVGDSILSLQSGEEALSQISINSIQEKVSTSEKISIEVGRGGNLFDPDEVVNLEIEPQSGLFEEDRAAIGISMENVGLLKLPFFHALWRGVSMTGQMLSEIVVGLGRLIGQAFVGQGSLDNVAGPVGIVGLVDGAAKFGFFYFLSFSAFISLNLAVLNILPLPALDGGRLLILIIETVARRRIKPKIVNAINGIGFAVLILLMLIITVNDVIRLF